MQNPAAKAVKGLWHVTYEAGSQLLLSVRESVEMLKKTHCLVKFPSWFNAYPPVHLGLPRSTNTGVIPTQAMLPEIAIIPSRSKTLDPSCNTHEP